MRRVLLSICLLGLPFFLANGAQTASQKSGQDQPAQSPGAQTILGQKAISPHLIEWYLDLNDNADLKQIWRLLKMEIPEKGDYRCNGTCDAETFPLQTAEDRQGEIVALEISFKAGAFYQYLFFQKVKTGSTGEEWKFTGNIDSHDQREAPPAYRIESGDGRTWFVLRESWGAGTGSAAYGESWYELKDAGVKRVLSYPVEGHSVACQDKLGRSYKSVLLRHERDNGVYTVPVQFLVTYQTDECGKSGAPSSLFGKGQKAYYVWDEEKGVFVLDSSRSEVTERQIHSVYGPGEFNHDAFLEENYQELSELARTGYREQKEWLKQFLAGMPDSPHKAALLNLLKQ